MAFAPRDRGEKNASLWLGLSVYHRTLFDALQDDWLRPLEGTSGHLLGIGSFAHAGRVPGSAHEILVRLRIDPYRLPRIRVWFFRNGKWTISSLQTPQEDDEAIYWPGPLPTFAITSLLTASSEENARLSGLAGQVSNVSFPVVPQFLEPVEDHGVSGPTPPDGSLEGITLPVVMDAVRGAMAMAVWAVPRVDPWLDLLCESLAVNSSEDLSSKATYLHSTWWNSPPWRQTASAKATSLQEQLWISAIHAFKSAREELSTKPVDLVEKIKVNVAEIDSPTRIDEWAKETIDVLRADASIDLTNWKSNPVGKAIQLVLTRPDPSVFTRWKNDVPWLPPTVWWSAASLCGLLHGYRRLPVSFRGELEQQRLLAVRALSVLDATLGVKNDAALIRDRAPEWSRLSGQIILSWDGIPFARKAENARSKWFSADLDDTRTKTVAERIAQSNRWNCIRTKLIVPMGNLPFSGGELALVDAPQRHLAVRSPIEFFVPPNAIFEQVLDPEGFRRCLATESVAEVSSPPVEPQAAHRVWSEEVPGLLYLSDFLTEGQEEALLEKIDSGDWSHILRRRVQHFGWQYDYRARKIDMSMRLGPLPEWASTLAERLKAKGLMPHVADQVIVNEYVGKQGIGKHTDCVPCFRDGVAMISLLESWEMIFRRVKSTRVRIPKLLARGSVAVLTGEARYKWSHEIPTRLTEPGGQRRNRRVSITFRKIDDTAVVRESPRSRKSKERPA